MCSCNPFTVLGHVLGHSSSFPFLIQHPVPYLFCPQASVAVDACLSLRDELAAASSREDIGAAAATSSSSAPSSRPRVLFAIDDYSALHGRTGYGRTDDEGRRVPLKVEDLNLVRIPSNYILWGSPLLRSLPLPSPDSDSVSPHLCFPLIFRPPFRHPA